VIFDISHKEYITETVGNIGIAEDLGKKIRASAFAEALIELDYARSFVNKHN
jgi:hypothetical protein